MPLLDRLGIGHTPVPPGGEYPSVVGRESDMFGQVLSALRPSTLVEFGSWEGRSAISWMTEARRLGLDLELVCVDTWLGSAEHWLDLSADPEWSRVRLRMRDGVPHVFDTFCHAMHVHGLSERVQPFRTTSSTAAAVLRRMQARVDAVYVDGAHDFRTVIGDVVDGLSILNGSGLVVGDDWRWPGVQSAVMAAASRSRRRVAVSPDEGTYVIGSREQAPALARLVEEFDWSVVGVRKRWGALAATTRRLV